MSNYSRLVASGSSFDKMIQRFGVVTVMNAKVYDVDSDYGFNHYASDLVAHYLGQDPLCELSTLKIANVTLEGPTKTITGGQYANPLIKFGKTARLEMQDALGNAEAVEFLCGGLVEYDNAALGSNRIALHNGSDFASEKVIIGDSFFIDENGQQVKVNIAFWQFLPDSLFNLNQDAEGDATVFDMNGDLLMTEINIGDRSGNPTPHGVFYSILAQQTATVMTASIAASATTVTVTNAPASSTIYVSQDGGLTWKGNSGLTGVAEGDTILVRAEKNGVVVASTTCVATA